MSDPVKCVCGGNDIGRNMTMSGIRFQCYVCGISGPNREFVKDAEADFNEMQYALKHHDLLTGFAEEVKVQTASANTADMAALHSMAVAVQKEMEE